MLSQQPKIVPASSSGSASEFIPLRYYRKVPDSSRLAALPASRAPYWFASKDQADHGSSADPKHFGTSGWLCREVESCLCPRETQSIHICRGNKPPRCSQPREDPAVLGGLVGLQRLSGTCRRNLKCPGVLRQGLLKYRWILNLGVKDPWCRPPCCCGGQVTCSVTRFQLVIPLLSPVLRVVSSA